MRRFFLFILCALLFSVAPRAQMIEQINQAAAAVHSLSCDFTQTKVSHLMKDPIVSTGHFYYTDRNQLRWEYQQPYPYCLMIDGQKIQIVSGDKSETIDMQKSTMAKRIAQLVMKSAKGQFLDDRQNFNVEMQVDGTNWKAILTPKQSKLKRLFVKAEIDFDTQQQMMTGMTLYEKSGDKTTIVLSNIQKNIALDSALFK